MRRDVFFRLYFPPALFAGKRVLEFGPDTGENALVFAQWGGRLTLVEPSLDAHQYIREYFERFGLSASLDEVVASSLLAFTPARKFDLVVAEGFIYTVKPTHAWIAKCADCLETDGFLVVSYIEASGAFMELLLKAIYRRVVADSAHPPGLEAARLLFQPKWDSIPHTRSLASWFMDVIENPFVRLSYCIDPAELLRSMSVSGFRLYSSWPGYRDALDVRWIKAPYRADEDLRASMAFVEQNRLSQFLGMKCFLPEAVPALSDSVRTLIEMTDGLIDEPSPDVSAAAADRVRGLAARLADIRPVGSPEDRAAAAKILSMMARMFDLMARNRPDGLVDACRTDGVFLATWGMPTHHGVFQFRGGDRAAAGRA